MWTAFAISLMAMGTAALGFLSNFLQFRKTDRSLRALHKRTNGEHDELLKRIHDLEEERVRVSNEYAERLRRLLGQMKPYSKDVMSQETQRSEVLARIAGALFTPEQIRQAGVEAINARLRAELPIDVEEEEG